MKRDRFLSFLLSGFLAGLSFGQGPTTVNLGAQGRNADFAPQAFTRPVTVGASLPSTCLVGQLFFNSSAAAGSNLLACTATNVWTGIGSQTIVLPLSLANGGTGTSTTPSLIGGTNITVTGTWPNQTVAATLGTGSNASSIQGIPVAVTTPTANQALLFSSVTSSYTPSTVYGLQAGMGTTTSGSSTLQVNISVGVRAVTTTTDAAQPTDCGGLVTYNNSSAVAVSLSQPALGGNFVSGCPITFRNNGAGTVTITSSNSTISGAASQTVSSGKGCQAISDGTNWQLGFCN